MAESKLTPQQEVFCNEYTKDRNGTQAAIRAGYKLENAKDQAGRLLSKAYIKKRITELCGVVTTRIQVEAEDILRELARVAFADIRTIFKEDGLVKEPKDWPDDIARCISSIEVTEEFEGYGADRTWIGYTKKIKFWDKVKSLELLGRHKVLFADKHIHAADSTLEALVAGSMKKEEGDQKK